MTQWMLVDLTRDKSGEWRHLWLMSQPGDPGHSPCSPGASSELQTVVVDWSPPPWHGPGPCTVVVPLGPCNLGLGLGPARMWVVVPSGPCGLGLGLGPALVLAVVPSTPCSLGVGVGPARVWAVCPQVLRPWCGCGPCTVVMPSGPCSLGLHVGPAWWSCPRVPAAGAWARSPAGHACWCSQLFLGSWPVCSTPRCPCCSSCFRPRPRPGGLPAHPEASRHLQQQRWVLGPGDPLAVSW